MSKREKIDQWSLLYRMIKLFPVGPAHNMYYRKIKIQHAERIPEGQPVIIAPNHQNALMDAMAFVIGIKFQTVFLARADIFKKKFVIDILTFLKIMPIYRIRDGIASLQKNDEIFDLTVNVLRNKINPLCLFPEGNHGDKRRLRPLVKGIFRIAFKAQEDYGTKPGVKIVPVGLDYSHYQKFRQTQLINFGEPIEVCEFWQDWEENQGLAMNKLRDRLSLELKKLMINIVTEEYYDLYMGLRKICNKSICKKEGLKTGDLCEEFLADKKMIAALDQCLEKEPERIKELDSEYKAYTVLREKLNLRDWVPVNEKYSILGNGIAVLFSIFTWPLVLLGIFNNWPHFFIPLKVIRGIKDPQFHSTAKWASGLAIMIIYYIILFILALIFLPAWWVKLLYIITLPSSGIFVLSYRRFIIKSWARIRYTFGMKRKKPDMLNFRLGHDRLIAMMDKIYESYKS